MVAVPWQRSDKKIFDDIEATAFDPRPEGVQSGFLIVHSVATIINNDLGRAWKGGDRRKLQRIRRICSESKVDPWVVPQTLLVLAAKLRLVPYEAFRPSIGTGPTSKLVGIFNVDRVDMRVGKVRSPRCNRRRRVLSDSYFNHVAHSLPYRAEQGVIRRRVVVPRLPERSFVAAVSIEDFCERIRAGTIGHARLVARCKYKSGTADDISSRGIANVLDKR